MGRDPLLGEIIGGRRVDALLGAGTHGRVYRVANTALGGRREALKVVSDDAPPEALLTLQHESALLAHLDHPNLIKLLDVGRCTRHGLHFAALDFLDGHLLADLVGQRLGARLVLGLGRDIARALAYLHAPRPAIVHRDLKPSNVVVDTVDGHARARVFDLGVASVVGGDTIRPPGTLVGTPAYLAPELLDPMVRPTPASDLYALGVLLYELLTATNPFVAETPQATLRAHAQRDAPRLGAETPTALAALIEALLQKQPSRRPPSAVDVAERLEVMVMDGTRSRTSQPAQRRDTLAQRTADGSDRGAADTPAVGPTEAVAPRPAAQASEDAQPTAAPADTAAPTPARDEDHPRTGGFLGLFRRGPARAPSQETLTSHADDALWAQRRIVRHGQVEFEPAIEVTFHAPAAHLDTVRAIVRRPDFRADLLERLRRRMPHPFPPRGAPDPSPPT